MQRIRSIDILRGFVICSMFFANFIKVFFEDPPLLLDHAIGYPALPLDLIAPLFGFIMGLCIPLSKKKFDKIRLLRRVGLIFFIGYIPNFIYRTQIYDVNIGQHFLATWGMLETWAVAYGITYIIYHKTGKVYRRMLFLLMPLIYAILFYCHPDIPELVMSKLEGGLLAASLSWAFIAAVGVEVGDWLINIEWVAFARYSLTMGAIFIVSGSGLHIFLEPMNRIHVNPSYILISVGICTILFLAFHTYNIELGSFVEKMGRWPLVAWISQGLIYVPVHLTTGLANFEGMYAGVFVAISVVITVFVSNLLIDNNLTIKA